MTTQPPTRRAPADFLNDTVRSMPPSGIRRFFDMLAEMKDVISLTIGEPDFT
ncbi:MAG TPA: pyridoxal phosphate-dependent aminotransferase, partial [Candidatus Limnocylindria bacterium]|nr:pyridoxal phosphate-dependent aminotransferase [Candidatus Limnocylindria bacterium]